MSIKIFVSYSHHDKKYLESQSLLGHLQGLQQDGVEFWYDKRIATGELWDNEIKARIQASSIALVLVSELFLNSAYITHQEIPLFIAKRIEEGMVIVPVILSECDWQRHPWLAETQFIPSEGETIERDYQEPGKRKALFLQIKRDLKRHIDRLKKSQSTDGERKSGAKPVSTLSTTAEVARDWENPFDLVAANNLDYHDIPQLFVGEYTDFQTINKHFDTVLEGQRGTGKTMILKYLAFETQIRIWSGKKRRQAPEFLDDRKNFVGIYCRLDQGVFDRSDLDAVETQDMRSRFFEHRMSLFVLSHSLKTINAVTDIRPFAAAALRAIKQRLALLLNEQQIGTCVDWQETYNFAQETIAIRVAQGDVYLASLVPGGGNVPQYAPWLSVSSQVVPFLQLLQELLQIHCPFFLLLDDFDVLRPAQQITVFRAASARRFDVVCFKYGIMTLGKKAILAGRHRTYREGHDYVSVELDWTEGLHDEYKKAVELMTAKRLESKRWPNLPFSSMLSEWEHRDKLRRELKQLMESEWQHLPSNKRPLTFDSYWTKYGNARYYQLLAQRRIHNQYAGYSTVIDISSGIYRQYVELCSQIVAKALASGWRPDSGKMIGPKTQDQAIRSYSRAMMDSISVSAGDTTALLTGPVEITSKHMVTLIESLSGLFRQRLMSDSREPEVFSISIKDSLAANETAKAILDVAVRESILQRRSADYTSKTAGGKSLSTFMLNRRLGPRWGLSPRMQGRIEITAADVVLAAQSSEAFIERFANGNANPEHYKFDFEKTVDEDEQR